MKLLTKLLCLACLLPAFANAQSNFKPGYIVTLKGDSVDGTIDYRQWEVNPTAITFRNTSGAENNYTATDIKAFGINGLEKYESYTLAISNDATEISKLALKPDTSTIIKTAFFKLTATGRNVCLLQYIDAIKTRFFVKSNSAALPEELIYHAYYNADESSSVKYVTSYRGQLSNLAISAGVDSKSFEDKIAQAAYNESDIVKIVQIINGASNQEFTSKQLTGISAFAGIGLNYACLKYRYSGVTATSGSVLPKLATGFDFFPNKVVQQFYIRTSLTLTVNQFKETVQNNGVVNSVSKANFTQYGGSLAPQFIYNFYNTTDLKVFAGAGIGLNFSGYSNTKYTTTFSDSLFPDETQNMNPSLSAFWISIPITAGVAINNRIEINVSYSPSSSLTSDNANSSDITSYQLGISYFFSGK